MTKKNEIRIKFVIAMIVFITTTLMTIAIDSMIDETYVMSKNNHTYHVFIDDNNQVRDTKKYAETWDGAKIVKIDGKDIEDGETVLILVH